MNHCPTCKHWEGRCTLPDDQQRLRHHGAPGDDSGTVYAWRLLMGVTTAPYQPEGEVSGGPDCPGWAKA